MLNPIISATALGKRLDDRDLRIVDVRSYLTDHTQGRREYAEGHIPGAIFLDLETDLSGTTGPGRHPLPVPQAFADRLGDLGIGDDHDVVVYDSAGGAIAARFWWMVRHFGHHRVSVLDGGWPVWRESDLPVTTEVPAHRPAIFSVRTSRDGTIDGKTLHSRLSELTVLDARAAERYRGDVEPIDAKAGHIPGAVNAPFSENLDDDGTFKTPEELARRFRDLGLDPQTEVVHSCGSGVTACHNILAMHLAGFAESLLYPGSWSDWSSSGRPVATGSGPDRVQTEPSASGGGSA